MTTRTRKSAETEQDVRESVEYLRSILTPGDTLYVARRRRSASGLTRWADVYAIVQRERGDYSEPTLEYLSGWIASACGIKRHREDGLQFGGAGYSIATEIAHSVGRALWPDGIDCLGDHCPVSDHSNGDRDYTPGHKHSAYSGASALDTRDI